MGLFDIIGPVMVGPSSSHTAGAVRLGRFARAIANRVIFLDGGKIVEEAAPAEFFDRPKTERAQRFLRTFTFDAVK